MCYKFKKTIRYGIDSDTTENMKLCLCYYATHVNHKELNWEKTSERIYWKDKYKEDKGCFRKITRNYEKERGLSKKSSPVKI